MTPLRANEPLGPALRRIVVAELDGALGLLPPAGTIPDETTVHEVRRALTRVRGVLRLVRSGMDPAARRIENVALRDVTRALAPSRDAAVMLATFEELVAKRPASPINAAVRCRLAADLDRAAAALAARPIAPDLEAVRDRAARWSIDDDTVGVVKAGLARLYRAASEAHARAQRKPDVDRLHELRKTSKHVRTALRSLDSDDATRAAKPFDRLATVLGTHHDFVVLHAALDDEAPVWLATRLDRDAKEERKRAFSRAGRLFDDSPKAFVRHVASTWAK